MLESSSKSKRGCVMRAREGLLRDCRGADKDKHIFSYLISWCFQWNLLPPTPTPPPSKKRKTQTWLPVLQLSCKEPASQQLPLSHWMVRRTW